MLQQANTSTTDTAAAGAATSTPPTSVDGVVETLQSSVLGIWADFVGHLPYLAMGLVVLVLTAILARTSSGIIHRLAQRADMRASLDDLLQPRRRHGLSERIRAHGGRLARVARAADADFRCG